MDFSLSEEHLIVRDAARRVAEEIVAPWAPIMDRVDRFVPRDVVEKLGEHGIWGIQIPEEYGGAEMDSVAYALVVEEISKVSGTMGLAVTVHNSVATQPLFLYGTEEQKERYVRDMATGKKIGAFSLTEPNAGSDAAGIQMKAERDGDEWVLNGQKVFVTNGGFADVFLVAAKFDPDAGSRGIGLFVVDRDAPGFQVGTIEKMMGVRGNLTSELYLENCRIPLEAVLGGSEQIKVGFKRAMQILDAGRIGIAAQALGIAQAAFDVALNYATERQQFGRPIVRFQGISFKLAEMATQLDAARLLVWRASSYRERGLPFTKEAAMCKYYASKVAMRVCTEAIQVLGGYGYVKKYPLERFFRDVKVTEIYEGTSEIMKLVIINQLLRSLR
ncbi:MAG: acyl-CoA dehydrogenase AcdA [Promethearchaeota archaeon]